MAVRIQLRRDTSTNWSNRNPILLPGELGFETDTHLFKLGNGGRWNDNSIYLNSASGDLNNALADYVLQSEKGIPGGVATLNLSGKIPSSQLPDAASFTSEIQSAIDAITTDSIEEGTSNLYFTNSRAVSATSGLYDTAGSATTAENAAKSYSDSALQAHQSDTTSIHGIADTSALATKTYSNSAVSAHNSATTSIHGIADTSALATKTYSNNAVSTHNSATTSVHGIADTSALATKTYADNAGASAASSIIDSAISTHNSDTTSVHGISDTSALATKTYADTAVSTHNSQTDNIHGIVNTSALATKTYVNNAASTAESDAKFYSDAQLSIHNLDTTSVHGIDDTSLLATKQYADNAAATAAANIINSAPSALDTLNELAAAINNDSSYAATVTTALGLKAPIDSPTFTGTVSGITKAMVGLGNVNNTTDANKPISSATQTALDLKAPLANPTFTGTVSGITKSMIGLGSVDNTADTNKPVSTATQTALDLKTNNLISYKTSSSSTRTLSSSDLYNTIELTNASEITVTIPDDQSDSAFPIGSTVEFRQMGDGRIKFQATSPATLVSTDSYIKTRTKYSSAVLEKRANNSWILIGDIDA